MSEAG
jgi:hypothetical protein